MKNQILNRTVILSTNDNPDYLNYLPYTQKAWELLGWKTLTFYFGETPPESTDIHRIVDITNRMSKYKVETQVQVMRLLAAHYVDEGLIMTGDVDMIPLTDYWSPKIDAVTVYGHDLTGRAQYPICYIAMNATIWREIFPEKTLDQLLIDYPSAISDDWYKWWQVDQEITTERLNNKVTCFIDRGFDSGLAAGRIDRADWAGTFDKAGDKIDAHMPRPFDQHQAERCLRLINGYKPLSI